MKINIVFLESDRGFTRKRKQLITSIINNTANRAAKLLNLKNTPIVNFTVYPFDRKHVIAFTQAEDWIQLSIPQKRLNRDELRGIIYHEIHHIKRGYSGYAKKKISFLEALFAEGLAIVFEAEQNLKYIPGYSKYKIAFIKKWLPRLRKQNLLSADFSYDGWFWGKEGKPKQLGYKIGTYLVNQIQKNYPELTSEELINKNAKDLLKLSKVNL